ncbi:hypothetical protein [Clostridium perfringens]|uniref:hypothetical protein n=1 Tax=Clostridium perfringens TaxID=1502 RepID=UPI0013E2F24D|nr:hypothetical protein [Clostridium perfringens]ELC8464278.1 hypothetical protein [Clostridium perfringens]NGT04488.1 hypothetical protein [Clostridium perfringens]
MSSKAIIIIIILGISILYRVNIERIKKNYKQCIEKISQENDIKVLISYLNDYHKMQETNQLNYTLITVLVMIILFYNS